MWDVYTAEQRQNHILVRNVDLQVPKGDLMGNALVIMKIYPVELEDSVKIEELVKGITKGEVKEVKREPIAFGLELVKIAIVIPDKEDDALPNLEEEIKAIPGVKNVEVEGLTLL